MSQIIHGNSDINGIPEITPVRPGHEFNQDALASFLAETLGRRCKLKVRQFEGGQSNPTFLLDYGNDTYVMRKQPPGNLLPSAHQVHREFRVMAAMAGTDVPVPGMIVLCEDPEVIGTSFYVMEHVAGRVFSDPLLPTFTADERTAIHEQMIDILAALHQVDYMHRELADFGRQGNYCARQIARWTKQYLASQTDDIADMDRLIAWLPRNLPEHDETTVVHGDFRLGNTIVHPEQPRIIAVLDWELSTLGDPLADLGYVCMDYHAARYSDEGSNRTNVAGIPGEAEQIARYCAGTNRQKPPNWRFYIVYNLFRGAAIIQGVYKRGLDGNASSQLALTYADACAQRAAVAWKLVEEAC